MSRAALCWLKSVDDSKALGISTAEGTVRFVHQYALTTRRPGKALKCLTFCVKTSTFSRCAVAAI